MNIPTALAELELESELLSRARAVLRPSFEHFETFWFQQDRRDQNREYASDEDHKYGKT